MFSRFFFKRKKDETGGDTPLTSPSTTITPASAPTKHAKNNAHALSSSPQQQQQHQLAQHSAQLLQNRTRLGLGSGNRLLHPFRTHPAQDSTKSHTESHRILTADQLEAMGVSPAIKNKINQSYQWLNDISMLRTKLVQYAQALIDLSKAGSELSRMGYSFQNNSSLYEDDLDQSPELLEFSQSAISRRSGNLPTPDNVIAAFEAWNASLELSTQQLFRPFLANAVNNASHTVGNASSSTILNANSFAPFSPVSPTGFNDAGSLYNLSATHQQQQHLATLAAKVVNFHNFNDTMSIRSHNGSLKSIRTNNTQRTYKDSKVDKERQRKQLQNQFYDFILAPPRSVLPNGSGDGHQHELLALFDDYINEIQLTIQLLLQYHEAEQQLIQPLQRINELLLERETPDDDEYSEHELTTLDTALSTTSSTAVSPNETGDGLSHGNTPADSKSGMFATTVNIDENTPVSPITAKNPYLAEDTATWSLEKEVELRQMRILLVRNSQLLTFREKRAISAYNALTNVFERNRDIFNTIATYIARVVGYLNLGVNKAVVADFTAYPTKNTPTVGSSRAEQRFQEVELGPALQQRKEYDAYLKQQQAILQAQQATALGLDNPEDAVVPPRLPEQDETLKALLREKYGFSFPFEVGVDYLDIDQLTPNIDGELAKMTFYSTQKWLDKQKALLEHFEMNLKKQQLEYAERQKQQDRAISMNKDDFFGGDDDFLKTLDPKQQKALEYMGITERVLNGDEDDNKSQHDPTDGDGDVEENSENDANENDDACSCVNQQGVFNQKFNPNDFSQFTYADDEFPSTQPSEDDGEDDGDGIIHVTRHNELERRRKLYFDKKGGESSGDDSAHKSGGTNSTDTDEIEDFSTYTPKNTSPKGPTLNIHFLEALLKDSEIPPELIPTLLPRISLAQNGAMQFSLPLCHEEKCCYGIINIKSLSNAAITHHTPTIGTINSPHCHNCQEFVLPAPQEQQSPEDGCSEISENSGEFSPFSSPPTIPAPTECRITDPSHFNFLSFFDKLFTYHLQEHTTGGLASTFIQVPLALLLQGAPQESNTTALLALKQLSQPPSDLGKIPPPPVLTALDFFSVPYVDYNIPTPPCLPGFIPSDLTNNSIPIPPVLPGFIGTGAVPPPPPAAPKSLYSQLALHTPRMIKSTIPTIKKLHWGPLEIGDVMPVKNIRKRLKKLGYDMTDVVDKRFATDKPHLRTLKMEDYAKIHHPIFTPLHLMVIPDTADNSRLDNNSNNTFTETLPQDGILQYQSDKDIQTLLSSAVNCFDNNISDSEDEGISGGSNGSDESSGEDTFNVVDSLWYRANLLEVIFDEVYDQYELTDIYDKVLGSNQAQLQTCLVNTAQETKESAMQVNQITPTDDSSIAPTTDQHGPQLTTIAPSIPPSPQIKSNLSLKSSESAPLLPLADIEQYFRQDAEQKLAIADAQLVAETASIKQQQQQQQQQQPQDNNHRNDHETSSVINDLDHIDIETSSTVSSSGTQQLIAFLHPPKAPIDIYKDIDYDIFHLHRLDLLFLTQLRPAVCTAQGVQCSLALHTDQDIDHLTPLPPLLDNKKVGEGVDRKLISDTASQTSSHSSFPSIPSSSSDKSRDPGNAIHETTPFEVVPSLRTETLVDKEEEFKECDCLRNWIENKTKYMRHLALRLRYIDAHIAKMATKIPPPFNRWQAELLFSTETMRTTIKTVDNKPKADVKISLCDPKRSQNVNFFLRVVLKTFTTIHDIIHALLHLQLDKLSLEILATTLQLFPTENEMQIYGMYKGTVEQLAPADVFLYYLSTTPDIKKHIEILHFMCDLDSLAVITNGLNTLQQASCEIMSSTAFLTLSVLLLRFGNFFNSTFTLNTINNYSLINPKCEALGFNIDLLSKVKLTKSGRIGADTNLLEFIIIYAERYCPTVLELPAQLTTISTASRIDINIVKSQIQLIEQAVALVKATIAVYENHLLKMPDEITPAADAVIGTTVPIASTTVANNILDPLKRPLYQHIIATLADFAVDVDAKLDELCDLFNTTVDTVDSSIFFTAQLDSTTDWAQLFKIIADFVGLFESTRDDLDAKRAVLKKQYQQQEQKKLRIAKRLVNGSNINNSNSNSKLLSNKNINIKNKKE